MRDMLGVDDDSNTSIKYHTFTPQKAEMLVEMASEQEMKDEEADRRREGAQSQSSKEREDTGQFTFTFPSTSTSTSTSSSGSQITPPATAGPTPRRRQPPPASIPNFPSSTDIRSPPPIVPFSPSPSAAPRSPARSPTQTPPNPSSLRLPMSQPFATPSTLVSSPWLSLAATSGAPTPSLDGPGRSSPHLGYPFENLNIGGTWSGANLWGEGSQSQGRRQSLEPPMSISPGGSKSSRPSGAVHGGMKAKPENNAMAVDPVDSPSKPSLPAALARRRGSIPKAGLTIPPTSHHAKSPSPLASSHNSPSPGPPTIQPLSPSDLKPMLGNPSTLVLDLRPPSSFHDSHLPASHSLPIPSTLLRRPAFSLAKLTQMLPPESKEAVEQWRQRTDIVLMDHDSRSAPDGSTMEKLASKFEREGFTGKLWYLRGGHTAMYTTGIQMSRSNSSEKAGSAGSSNVTEGLMAGGLGKFAFLHGSTGSGRKQESGIAGTPGLNSRADPFASSSVASNTPSRTQRGGLDKGFGLRLGLAGSPKPMLQPANPFFDNIRQNLELSHGGITERIPLNLPDHVTRRSSEFPSFLEDLVGMSNKDGADRLAEEFYQLELGEQKRLQAIMNWHTNVSGQVIDNNDLFGGWAARPGRDAEDVSRLADWNAQHSQEPGASAEDYFPFSITAGVERGTKNRYKNIWPYDYSRVRLESPADDSDYINASFIQPRATSRRYIATQGPLDATFRDFWTLIWEQDVKVIVMITKQFEGGLVKCGNYWEDQQYGSLQPTGPSGFDFGMRASTPRTTGDAVAGHIKRVFVITHAGHPEIPPRRVIQVQCISWPDFDVPETPEVLLSLIREVDLAMDEVHGVACDERSELPPVLVHCSAGVGRTGSFIVVDAISDALRRERRLSHEAYMASLPDQASVPALSRPIPSKAPSGESTKSVTFAEPFLTSNEQSQNSRFLSPSAQATTTISPSVLPEVDLASGSGEKMEVDPFFSGKRSTPTDDGDASPALDERFTRHRGSFATSVSSTDPDDPPRRPSLQSVSGTEGPLGSSEASSQTATYETRGGVRMPQPVTKSNARHRPPSPISHLNNPVPDVLGGMRAQRMSLVQSLRQYVFVHRAIIQQFLNMVDEERRDISTSDDSAFTQPTTNANTSTTSISTASSAPTSTTGTDDDAHFKRRASPTELMPDMDLDRSIVAAGALHGDGLKKRASFKKMRPARRVEGMEVVGNTAASGTGGSSDAEGGGTASASGSGTKRSPVKKARSSRGLGLGSVFDETN